MVDTLGNIIRGFLGVACGTVGINLYVAFIEVGVSETVSLILCSFFIGLMFFVINESRDIMEEDNG